MDELSLISRQEPGIISLENFDQLKQILAQQLEVYSSIVYTEDSLKAAKKDKSQLNKLKKSLDERRKEIKKYYMQPYEIVEGQIKELIALIDEPLALIGGFISQEEEQAKKAKRSDIRIFYERNAGSLGEFAEAVFQSPAFYEKKWENASTSVKVYQDAIKKKIGLAAIDISTICATGGKHTAALLDHYLKSLSMDGLTEYKASLEAAEQSAAKDSPVIQEADDKVVGYKVLRLSGTQQQLAQILDQMELLGIEVDELEDGMPQEMRELADPDFNSFVAFDIETTGTFGAANGDEPPQITEIGAVKVINGQIVERFSELANPGRKITPRIARLTHSRLHWRPGKDTASWRVRPDHGRRLANVHSGFPGSLSLPVPGESESFSGWGKSCSALYSLHHFPRLSRAFFNS